MDKAPIAILAINQLQPNPFQPRTKIAKDELAELVQSIKAYGILEPLVVADTPAGYQIIAGERRWRAAKEAGLAEVPVILRRTTPKGMLELALVENVQRIDLSPIERAQAFQQLIREFGFTPTKLAEQIGKSGAFISNSLKLLALPDAVKDGLLGGSITEGHARALAQIDDEKAMVECYKIVLKENASVRRAEELARRFKELIRKPKKDESGKGRPVLVDDKMIKQWEQKFQTVFHTKSALKVIRSNRQTRVTIVLHGGPEQTQADFDRILAFSHRKGTDPDE